jgi:hypothetical protein
VHAVRERRGRRVGGQRSESRKIERSERDEHGQPRRRHRARPCERRGTRDEDATRTQRIASALRDSNDDDSDDSNDDDDDDDDDDDSNDDDDDSNDDDDDDDDDDGSDARCVRERSAPAQARVALMTPLACDIRWPLQGGASAPATTR